MVTAVDVAGLVGYRYRTDDYYEVGREKIREYARAVQDFHPAHWKESAAGELGFGGLVAPATFSSIVAMRANRGLFETVLAGYDVIVHTDQVFEMYKPVVAGARLRTEVELTAVRQVAGKDLLTVTNTFTDQSGEIVQVSHATVIGITSDDVDSGIADVIESVIMSGLEDTGSGTDARSDSADEESDRPATQHSQVSRERLPHTAIRFEDLAVGDELPTRTFQLTRGDLVNYAGVSGDANPIHWHERVASLAGLPDVIAHGMLTMGLGAGFVSDWLGDPCAVLRYGARLSNYTVVEAVSAGGVEFSGRIKSLDPETRTATIVLVAKSAGRKIFGLATTDIRLH
ncbi:fused (3R)-hydroxyacyl-ACP dehydratase subunits HadA/HadB [Nocardia huaxiensis]|uniref:fused (3R)-hydroxyacyl-ACP dehydratase subunits HadA/HadB n=1 Tax=Nocardia huaxiensis TaxID=2755382 RepID=UPI001E2E0AB2|nr:fused (3R)-hydroxyacyl-ACP dehydratase subunits HadA/HadB [Nocardia huaxiensis]UFS97898.1 MaoC family dehydratase N-terminal domain-containing protein [Nocardia huaxiensis]